MKNLIKNFLLCGAIGWCFECFFTGCSAFRRIKKDKTLRCQTSIWMFPIYGFAAFFQPIIKRVKKINIVLRGSIYSFFIFLIEFCSGSLLKVFKACPWDYSKAKLNVKGLIRIDYIPAWVLLGFIYEHVLTRRTNKD